MIKRIYYSIKFRFLSLCCLSKIETTEKIIYLTFDDGPESGITETVLNILNKYNAKATFFCTGENVEKHPSLVQLIKNDGHSIGNHTYSHVNGLNIDYKTYVDDVNRGKEIIQSDLFRPPGGMLTLFKFLKLHKNNKIILWNISSNDTNPDTNWEKHCLRMVKMTKPGSIVLFHFSHEHAKSTKAILSNYIEEVYKLGFNFKSIK